MVRGWSPVRLTLQLGEAPESRSADLVRISEDLRDELQGPRLVRVGVGVGVRVRVGVSLRRAAGTAPG